MFYLRRRIVLALIIYCLVIQLGEAIKNSYAAALPKETYREVYLNTKSEHEKLLAEADKAIVDAELVIYRYDAAKPQETEKASEQELKENIVIADRGGYKPQVKVSQYNLSDEEFNLMAQVVQAEAGGEPFEGQVAVANVILNRVKAGWGKTVTEVINQSGQFTPVRKKPSPMVKEAVKEALYGKSAVPEGTLFFQNLDISTDFTVPKNKKYVTKIGLHTFYR